MSHPKIQITRPGYARHLTEDSAVKYLIDKIANGTCASVLNRRYRRKNNRLQLFVDTSKVKVKMTHRPLSGFADGYDVLNDRRISR
jgi:hypothetical protein